MKDAGTDDDARRSPIPLSLYIHIPWCVRKCPYCDFNSHEAGASIPEEAYVDRLLEDLARDVDHYEESREIHSIFIGGGTPSLFSGEAITRLLTGVRSALRLAAGAEVTLEANPGTIDTAARRFHAFRAAGVNRISLGAQSFDDMSLSALGRIHCASDIDHAFEAASSAGFSRINIDLMHGLPGQSSEHAARDLQRALGLGADHISWYQLTLEPNTVFYRRPPSLPDEDIMAEIQDHGSGILAGAGLKRYEVSAFCRPGEEARHNLNYWAFGDYLGIGAGAHGKITRADGTIERTRKTRLPRDYLAEPRVRRDPVPQSALVIEFLLNALRLTGGFDLALFEQRTGLPRQALHRFIERSTSRALLEVSGERLKPTPTGMNFLNELLLLADDDTIQRG